MIKVRAQVVRDECSAMAKEAGRCVGRMSLGICGNNYTVYQIQYTNNYYQHIPRREEM